MRLIASTLAAAVALGCWTGLAWALSLPHRSLELNAPTAQGGGSSRRVIVIVIDTATWEEYTSSAAPFIRQWLKQCAVGLMNTRVQGLPTPAAAYLTLGAGSRAAAEQETDVVELALNYGETYGGRSAWQLFHALTGKGLPPGAVAYLGLPAAAQENAQAMYALRLGLLGQALRQAGIATAAVGNADLPGGYHRGIAAIVMDEQGIVTAGDVGPRMHRVAPDSEPPIMTDYRALEAALDEALSGAQVVAVETGDLSRIAECSALMAPERAAVERRAAIMRMDGFVQRVVQRMRGVAERRVYLVTPTALAATQQRADMLTPIAAWGAGIAPGLLTSPSTRRAGVVANVDLAPSILAFFDLAAPPGMIGRPARVTRAPYAAPLAYVTALQSREERAEASRPYVLKAVSGLTVAIFAVAAAILILGGPAPRRVAAGVREAALLVVACPLALLIVPGDALPGPATAVIAVLAATAALYAGARLLGRWQPPYVWLTGAFAIALGGDLVLGQRLVQRSLLSYSVTAGARYYGLGNELGGVLLAALPLALGGWLGAKWVRGGKRLTAVIALCCAIVVIAHPTLGANFGIALPAAFGFGLMALALYSARITGRHVLMAVVVAAIVALAVGLVDRLISPQARSHIGQWVAVVQTGGAREIADVIARKTAMNWLLVGHSISTWVLVSAAAVMAGAALGRSRALSEEVPAHSALSAALIGGSAALAASFFLNDSGVLAAAWGFSVIAATLMYVVFDWRLRQGMIQQS